MPWWWNLERCGKGGWVHTNTELLSYSKISNWFFGHSHDKHELYLDNINFISNPRGRPHDKNRVRYSVNTIEI